MKKEGNSRKPTMKVQIASHWRGSAGLFPKALSPNTQAVEFAYSLPMALMPFSYCTCTVCKCFLWTGIGQSSTEGKSSFVKRQIVMLSSSLSLTLFVPVTHSCSIQAYVSCRSAKYMNNSILNQVWYAIMQYFRTDLKGCKIFRCFESHWKFHLYFH